MTDSEWLLDTNVLSELVKSVPSERVVDFVRRLERLVVPAVVVFELEVGIQRLAPGRKRTELARWLDALLGSSLEVLALDAQAARAAARIVSVATKRGRVVEVRDALIVGTAASAGLGVATRNVAHLRGHGVRVLNPFEA